MVNLNKTSNRSKTTTKKDQKGPKEFQRERQSDEQSVKEKGHPEKGKNNVKTTNTRDVGWKPT